MAVGLLWSSPALAEAAESPKDLDAFFRAVTDGRSERVERGLAKHSDWAEAELYLGIRPLYRAAVMGRSEVIRVLIDHGANVDQGTDRGTRPLHAAAQQGHLAIVEMLLSAKAEVSAKDESGQTPLHLACRYKRGRIVSELIRSGADTDWIDSQGRSPLHWAAGLGQLKAVKQLVSEGADINLVDNYGYTPVGLTRTMKRNSFGDIGGFLEAKGGKDLRPKTK